MDCICNSRELFNFGCRCGAFAYTKAYSVWFNGIIYTIAKTEDEARELSISYLSEFEDYDSDWVKGDGWKIIPDSQKITILVSDDSDEQETRNAKEWVEYSGPGFLAAI